MSDSGKLPPALAEQVTQALASKQRIVLVTGVFDLLHEEHLLFLQKAKEVGELLLVGIESDARVRELKGLSRPIQPEATRLAQVTVSESVDATFILPENFNSQAAYRQLLRQVNPSILAVSSHSPYLENKRDLMKEIGGEVVVVHQHNPAVSTSIKLQQPH